MNDVDQAIEQYRKQLVAEAELAETDLDEIEDHLRSLTEELRDRGMPAAEAVTEAARRLGDPKRLAREHVRVRTAFGTKLSRARAWSAALLVVPAMAWTFSRLVEFGMSRFLGEAGVCVLLGLALVIGRSWARPLLLGWFAFLLVPNLMVAGYDFGPYVLAWNAAVVAFLLPWRRGELTPAAWNLVLQVWTFCATSLATMFVTFDDSVGTVIPFICVLTSLLAIVGSTVRAKWSAVMSGASAVLLVASLAVTSGDFLWSILVSGRDAYVIGLVGTGVVTAGLGAWLSWRTARSRMGTLSYLAH